MRREASKIVLGNPLDPETTMGPLVDQTQTQRVTNYIEAGRNSAKLVYGGNRLTIDGSDCYVEPTIFSDVPIGSTIARAHPRDLLLGAQAAQVRLRVCDHYSGVQARMEKSLQLQAQMTQELGLCVFDVTLDCEDGAPVGGEKEHAQGVAQLVSQSAKEARVYRRIGTFLRNILS